jgi:hypothetical protein
MWRRMLLSCLFNWLILKRRGSVRRFQRMKMWRRTLLRRLFEEVSKNDAQEVVYMVDFWEQ